MLPCDDYELVDSETSRINVYGLISTIRAHQFTGAGFKETLCVLIVVSDARGQHRISLECQSIDTGKFVFRTVAREIQFGRDPLRLMSIGYRIRDCHFSEIGGYVVRFRVAETVISEAFLVVR
jgi:hypothetical protein